MGEPFVIRILTKYTMIAKLTGLFCLLALASASNQIHRVEVFTSDCFQCGMSVLGKISLEVYGQGGRYCKTGMLDNVGSDDYNRGTISTFAGSTIGNCNNYNMGNTRNDVSMKITHSGTDGGKFDWIKVYADSGHYECLFSSTIDDGESETGHSCKWSN